MEEKLFKHMAFGLANLVYKTSLETNPISHNRRYEIYYIYRVLFTIIYQTTILLLLGLLLHSLKGMVVAMTAFATLRWYAGGLHTDTMTKCTVITSMIMITSILLGKLINIYFCIPLLIISFILLIIYAPKDHFNKPIVSIEERTRCKRNSIIVFIFWLIVITLFPIISGVATISIFIESLSLISAKPALK